MEYACKAGIRGGVARCRNMAPCPEPSHRDGSAPAAPQPDVVLVKVNLSGGWDPRFAAAGIPLFGRSPERSWALAAQHRAQAEQLGRNPFAIRDEGEPESADSGCPVFGKAGAQLVAIKEVVPDLFLAGFRLVGKPHRLARQNKPPVRLVLEFAKDGDLFPKFPWALYQELITTCFGQVDVWANPRDQRGEVVHTVNCGRRDDKGTPSHQIRFADGDWDAVKI